jgi:hypothetical protein
MKDALDLKSKSGIHRLIMALEERGFLRRLPNRARAIEILRMPDMPAAKPASFISSKDGGTPLSCILCWMNWSSSSCLRVSMRHLLSTAGRGRRRIVENKARTA